MANFQVDSCLLLDTLNELEILWFMTKSEA